MATIFPDPKVARMMALADIRANNLELAQDENQWLLGIGI